jgi:hypothetical protein
MKTIVWTFGIFALTVLGGQYACAKETHLIDYALEDQFKTVHRPEDVRGKIAMLIGGDGKGGPKCEAWADAIVTALRDHPRYTEIIKLGYADLRVVPTFMKGWARRKFPKNRKEWAMMDWRGDIAKAYEFVPRACNILVFTPDLKLAHHAWGRDPDPAPLNALLDAMKRLLNKKP